MSSTVSTAAVTSASTGFGELELAQVLGQRAGVDADADRRAELLGLRDDLGDLLGAADVARVQPHAVRAGVDRLQRERVVEVDVGDDRDRRLAHDRLAAPRRPARAGRRRARCRRRPRRRGGSGPSSPAGWRSPSWSSSGRRPARRRRWARRRRGSAAPRPWRPCTNGPWPRCRCDRLRHGAARAGCARARSPARRAGPRAPPRGALRAAPACDAGRCASLDVGCGDARAARPGARARRHRRRPRRAARLPRAVRPAPTRPQRLPFADGAFDLAYSSSVVEHVPPAAPRALRGRAAPRRARLVRADAGLVVPDRAARAAAGRALAARRRCAGPTGASARQGPWEDDLAAAPRELEAPVPGRESTPSASAARQELGRDRPGPRLSRPRPLARQGTSVSVALPLRPSQRALMCTPALIVVRVGEAALDGPEQRAARGLAGLEGTRGRSARSASRCAPWRSTGGR